MAIQQFQDVPIKLKLISIISALILAISLFVFFYFPAIQNRMLVDEFEKRLGTVTDMVALGSGVGLGTGQLIVLKNVFDWAKQDSSLEYIVVLNQEGMKISQFPKELDLNYENLLKDGDTIKGNRASFTRKIMYGGEEHGTILLGAKMDYVRKAANRTRLIAAIIGIVILILGVFVSQLFGRYLSKQLNRVVLLAESISSGNYDEQFDNPSKDEIGRLGQACNEMVEVLRNNRNEAQEVTKMIESVVDEINHTAEKQLEGDIEARASVGQATGSYKDMVEGFNGALDSAINPTLESIEILQEYASGNLDRKLRDLPGKQIVLTNALNEIRKNLKTLIDEGGMLVDAATQGRLDARGNLDKFEGDYEKIIDGMNRTLDAVVKPSIEAAEVLKQMANGDLSIKMKGDYKGDHAVTKQALNSTIDALNEILSQINVAIAQVTSGAKQISDSSQSLSQGATEQASSLEEISSSLVQIGSQTRVNSENAEQANLLTEDARAAADTGNQKMQQMLDAMHDINESSSEISRIIKVIDEIAFQTNLLALNAAVEAARAGVHGKGFAVVADEVRNLAQRSASAAKETTELIEGSTKNVSAGSKIANETAESLNKIVDSIVKVTDLIGDIAKASKEQSEGIAQINEGLQQVDSVTQANTANAEESASASQELSGQATQLRKMIANFKLNERYGTSSASSLMEAKPEYSQPDYSRRSDRNELDSMNRRNVVDPNQIISLDDDDFENF